MKEVNAALEASQGVRWSQDYWKWGGDGRGSYHEIRMVGSYLEGHRRTNVCS